MPFEALETLPGGKALGPQAGISYERPKRKNSTKFSAPRLIVSIPTTVAGLCKSDFFRFDIGTGNDHGMARITGLPKGAVTAGAATATMMKHTLCIRFGEVPALGEDSAAMEHVPLTKVDNNTWDIKLPTWFKPEQTLTVQRNIRKPKAA